jgi:hypothetical protein
MLKKTKTESFVNELSISQEKCLIKHARELFTKLVKVGPGITDQNIKGITADMDTAIELAEVFQRRLMNAGYTIREEHREHPTRDGQPARGSTILGSGIRTSMGECGTPGRARFVKKTTKINYRAAHWIVDDKHPQKGYVSRKRLPPGDLITYINNWVSYFKDKTK